MEKQWYVLKSSRCLQDIQGWVEGEKDESEESYGHNIYN